MESVIADDKFSRQPNSSLSVRIALLEPQYTSHYLLSKLQSPAQGPGCKIGLLSVR